MQCGGEKGATIHDVLRYSTIVETVINPGCSEWTRLALRKIPQPENARQELKSLPNAGNPQSVTQRQFGEQTFLAQSAYRS